MPKSVERVKHRLSFDRAHAAATHCVVEHAVTILPWTVVIPVSDVVQHRGIPIFSFEWSAHDRPEVASDGCAIDNRSDWGEPDKDRESTRLNSSHVAIQYGVVRLK